MSPIKFTNTVTIDRPPAEVFAFLAAFENLSRWNYAISQTRNITSGPVRVGSQYRQTRTVPRRSEETFEVTDFEPDRRIAIRGVLGPFAAELTYLLDRTGDATTLTNAVHLQPPGVLSVIAPLATARIKSAVAANLDRLKQILERDGST